MALFGRISLEIISKSMSSFNYTTLFLFKALWYECIVVPNFLLLSRFCERQSRMCCVLGDQYLHLHILGRSNVCHPHVMQCRYFHFASMSLHDYLLANRVGEASNPGPFSCNPHAILSNKKEILELKSHVIMVSETSATKVAQSEFASNIRHDGFSVFGVRRLNPKYKQLMDALRFVESQLGRLF